MNETKSYTRTATSFGGMLKSIRRFHRKTQDEAAKILGIAKQSVCRIESDRAKTISIDFVKKVCNKMMCEIYCHVNAQNERWEAIVEDQEIE